MHSASRGSVAGRGRVEPVTALHVEYSSGHAAVVVAAPLGTPILAGRSRRRLFTHAARTVARARAGSGSRSSAAAVRAIYDPRKSHLPNRARFGRCWRGSADPAGSAAVRDQRRRRSGKIRANPPHRAAHETRFHTACLLVWRLNPGGQFGRHTRCQNQPVYCCSKTLDFGKIARWPG
jgi:hypothetical protein